MKLLKSRRAWVMFKNANMGDNFREPEKFPCYVYFVIQSWGMQEREALYLYEEDLKIMWVQIKKLGK